MQTVRLLLCVIFVFFAHGAYDWFNNQAQYVGPDVPSGKLISLSFAPYHEGYSPLTKKYPLPEHIDNDLSLLADKVYNTRTYSSLGGMQPTPKLARKHQLTMLQGAWLGDNPKDNQIEIEALINSANQNPDVVTRVMVGNEVLLRRDLSVDQLIDYIRTVKRAVKQPVSYADVWSMYMKYPQLMKEVDFITIHVLPYWEDEPVAVDEADEHLEKIVKQIEDKAQEIAPGKPILIGETGWPGAGRQRGAAIPSVVNEAKFIRAMIQVANRHGFDYNIVEAFNQSWKSHMEGVVGANWGLFSVDRKPVFPLTGRVYENPKWQSDFVLSTLVWLGIIACYFKKLQFISLTRKLVFLGITQILCISLIDLAGFLWYTSYTSWERAYTACMVLANSVFGLIILARYSAILQEKHSSKTLVTWLGNLYLLFLLLAIVKTFALANNGRYLSFPIEQFTIPVWGIIGLMICHSLKLGKHNLLNIAMTDLLNLQIPAYVYRGLSYLAYLALPAMLLGEIWAFMNGSDLLLAHPGVSESLHYAVLYTVSNQQLLVWLLFLLVLALPVWSNQRQPTISNTVN
ncbi:glycosyl hydrolase family 17 protein [Methylomonas sp. AM2-LC]|uniref:glycoside hydrolase family 17 protein n=1 Tax=Methylomonas sp. AM2-LC TaxID=3153301 RepID=UPI0032665099